VEPGPGQPAEHARDVAIDPSRDEVVRIDLESAIPRSAAKGHAVREAREDPERAAHEVLGPADGTSARSCSCPTASTSTPTRAIPSSSSTATSVHVRRLREEPPDPALPASTRSGSVSTAYNGPSRSWPTSSTGLDRPRVPALRRDPGPAREPLLRRLVRGELGEPRAVRGRHPVRAGAVRREERSRPRPGRARFTYGGPRAAGRPRGPGPLPGRVERLLGGLPRSHRLSAPT